MNLNENYITLLKKAKVFSKNKPDSNALRIAVLGSYSTQFFVSILRYMLYIEGINSNIYEARYNSIYSEVLDDNSELYSFNPKVIIILTYHADIKEFPELLNYESIFTCLNNDMSYFKNMWGKLSSRMSCHIFQTNFVLPIERCMGNLEANYLFSSKSYYNMLNLELIKQRDKNVTIVDAESLASLIGKYNWFDYSAYFLNKSGFNLKYIGDFVCVFVKQILALNASIRKCLVLDLDNTLWGGEVGDDGCYGVQLDPNNALGEAFRHFQQYVLNLKNRGVILAVCSKNNENIAKAPFINNKHMILKLEDISCFIANWEDKASNIINISKELNIGLDSIVFFDDNIAEREIVGKYLPDVTVIDVPVDPAEYALELEKSSPFEWLQITKEDLSRPRTYYDNKKRIELGKDFINYDEYLLSLEMKGSISLVENQHIERYTQLINKSNQFNLRTQRYTEADIKKMISDDKYKCMYITLEDKFSDYGLISCIILKKIKKICFIDTWLMSCRVFKRGVEYFAFEKIIEEALKMDCNKLVGEYIPTPKNSIVQNLYERLNFSSVSQIGDISKIDHSLLYVHEDLKTNNINKYFITQKG